MTPNDELQALRAEVAEMRRAIRRATMVAVVLGGLAVFGWSASAVRAQPHTGDDITTHRLTIVDEHGVRRVVIAAPAPDPIVAGRSEKRQAPVSGVLLFDAAGNERGGYVTEDASPGGALLTLDDATGGQVTTLYANADDGGTVSVRNRRKGLAVMTASGTARIIVARPGAADVTIP